MNSESSTTWYERVKIIAVISFPVLWPFMNFLNTNRDENYSLLRLGLYGALSLLVVLFGFIIFQFLFKKFLTLKQASTIYAVGVISMFCYPMTYPLAHGLWHGYYLKTWAGFAVFLLLLSWLLSHTRTFQNFVFVLCTVLVVVPSSQYLIYQIQVSFSSHESNGNQDVVFTVESETPLPSVYHILLDEYARADVLSKELNFDNSDFLRNLRERGFFIADEAMSNYNRTALSVPSILSMEYMFQGDMRPQITARAKTILNGGGPVFEWFHNAGYYTALLSYIGAYCAPDSPDFCYQAGSIRYGDLESELIALTPFTSIADYLLVTVFDISPEYYELWDMSKTVTGFKTNKPVFAHIHAFLPHPPYRFTETCEPIAFAQQKDQRHSDGYIENLMCANIGSLELIDTIIRQDPGAIIIVQADHGARRGIAWGNWQTDDKWKKLYSILSAWRIPPGMDCQKDLHPNLTTVNTFRIVQGCLKGMPPDLLPSRWFHEDESTNQYIEIKKKNK